MSSNLSAIPGWLWVVVGVLLVVEIVLYVIALRDLYKRPVEQVVFGNKWIWVAIILFGELIGVIVYFAAGRKPAPVSEAATPSAPTATRAESAADALYGAREDADR